MGGVNGREVKVTDHAVLRYLERARGFDIEQVRRHVAALCAPAIKVGARSLRAEGVKFEFSRIGTVVTVVPNGPLPSQTSQRQSEHFA